MSCRLLASQPRVCWLILRGCSLLVRWLLLLLLACRCLQADIWLLAGEALPEQLGALPLLGLLLRLFSGGQQGRRVLPLQSSTLMRWRRGGDRLLLGSSSGLRRLLAGLWFSLLQPAVRLSFSYRYLKPQVGGRSLCGNLRSKADKERHGAALARASTGLHRAHHTAMRTLQGRCPSLSRPGCFAGAALQPQVPQQPPRAVQAQPSASWPAPALPSLHRGHW